MTVIVQPMTRWSCSDCHGSFPESAPRTVWPNPLADGGGFGIWLCPSCALTREKGYTPIPLMRLKSVPLDQPKLFNPDFPGAA